MRKQIYLFNASIIFVICFLIVKNIAGQSQSLMPYQSLISVNPSFVGSNGGLRNQSFGEIPYSKNNYNTYNFSNTFDCYLPSLKSGLGLSLNYESMSDVIRNRVANLTYSRPIKINGKLKIVPALQLGYKLKEIHYSWMYGYPGSYTGWMGRENYFFASSVLVNYKNFYGGLVAHNEKNIAATRSDNALYYFSTSWQLNASYNLNLANDFQINFSDVYISDYSSSKNLISVNGLFYKHFLIGVSAMQYYVGLNTGLKTDFFSAQLSYKTYTGNLIPESLRRYWQFMLSFSLRNRAQRHAMTNFEEW